MADRFDVVVVGARCAGSPLAALLARQGVSVALVERAEFPKDTVSTHIFQAAAINFLRRLGVLEKLLETGARPHSTLDLRQEDFHCRYEVAPRPGDLGAFMSVRRFVLDPILRDAAADAGAEVLMSTRVTGVVHDGDRVAGVRVVRDGEERALHATLVVGADGRNSTLGKLVGARKYHVVPNYRFGYWSFFEGAQPGSTLAYHRWEGRFVIAVAADGGLYQVIVLPDLRFLPEFRVDREAAFMSHARASAPVARALDGAARVGKLFGMLKFECFLREAAGPGWALVGDAGHFKDPAPGQGIADAFRQSEALAPVIAGAIRGPEEKLDAALHAWARWRDRDGTEHHWLAADFGAAGRQPSVVVEAMRHLQRDGRIAELGDIIQHRRMPSSVFTPPLLVKGAAAAMRRPGGSRGAVLREFRELVTTEARRRRLGAKPEFVGGEQHRDAGETEVPEEVAA